MTTTAEERDATLPAQVRQLSKGQLVERVRELRAAVQSGAELTRLQRGHMIQLLMLWETYQVQELEELDSLIEDVRRVKLQSEAFRKALLWDLRGYAGATIEDRRKTKDRVFKALAGAPPVDPTRDDFTDVADISGQAVGRPDRFST